MSIQQCINGFFTTAASGWRDSTIMELSTRVKKSNFNIGTIKYLL